MHRFRLTTRRIMALVPAPAVAPGLGIPAVRVAANRDDHLHCWASDPNGSSSSSSAMANSPFWPRDWRHLLGRPWRHAPVCRAEQEQRGEFCQHAHPEMIVSFASGEVGMVAPEAIRAAQQSLNEKPHR